MRGLRQVGLWGRMASCAPVANRRRRVTNPPQVSNLPHNRRGGSTLKRSPLLLVLCAVLASGEIIDQIAATVDSQVITASEVDEAVRVAAFLNGEKADLSSQARRKMTDRLIEQVLVLREMDLTRYPEPAASDVAEALKEVKSRFQGDSAFQQALADYRLTPGQLERSLRRQLTLLRFIDLRFRPEVQVQENDVMQYYETVFLPEARKKGTRPDPAFDDVEDQCEAELTAQLVDKRVDAWLAEARSRSRIEYAEEAFR